MLNESIKEFNAPLTLFTLKSRMKQKLVNAAYEYSYVHSEANFKQLKLAVGQYSKV